MLTGWIEGLALCGVGRLRGVTVRCVRRLVQQNTKDSLTNLARMQMILLPFFQSKSSGCSMQQPAIFDMRGDIESHASRLAIQAPK
jgi:hypothetical protein